MPAPPKARSSTPSSSSAPGLGRAVAGREDMAATYPRSSLDLDHYRAQADRFMEELMREHYLHYSGQKEQFEIEAIYERNSDLDTRRAVEDHRVTVHRQHGPI